jgi:hypothetical protein
MKSTEHIGSDTVMRFIEGTMPPFLNQTFAEALINRDLERRVWPLYRLNGCTSVRTQKYGPGHGWAKMPCVNFAVQENGDIQTLTIAWGIGE